MQQIFPYIETMKQTKIRMTRAAEKIPIDFLNIQVNLRTAYKFTKYCCICGASPTHGNPIESHHVKAIKKAGHEITGFTEIMKTLNNKQIVCCKQCHQKIHSGK